MFQSVALLQLTILIKAHHFKVEYGEQAIFTIHVKRVHLLQRSYGGEVIVAPSGVPADHPDHYQNMAVTLCKENADYFDVDQYDNPNNPEAYYRSLGPEVGPTAF